MSTDITAGSGTAKPVFAPRLEQLRRQLANQLRPAASFVLSVRCQQAHPLPRAALNWEDERPYRQCPALATAAGSGPRRGVGGR